MQTSVNQSYIYTYSYYPSPNEIITNISNASLQYQQVFMKINFINNIIFQTIEPTYGSHLNFSCHVYVSQLPQAYDYHSSKLKS